MLLREALPHKMRLPVSTRALRRAAQEEINNRQIRKFGYDNANEGFLRFEGSVGISISENEYYGNAIVAILEKDKMPLKIINTLSKKVIIDEETFELAMEIRLGVNEIEKKVQQLT